MTITRHILVALSLCALFACSKTEKNKPEQFTVQTQILHKTLYFNGTVEPIRENSLSSPVDAVVDEMNIPYGHRVKKNQVVYLLNSADLQKQYNDTLTEYLKAKDAYTIAKTKFNGTEDLWHSGLISKNNFLSEKSSLNNARISLIQATRKHNEMLGKIDDNLAQDTHNLNIADIDALKKILASEHNLIRIKAPSNGVLLYPPNNPGDTQNKRLGIGNTVKAGQVLALIGDLSGIHIAIDIPEVEIEKIHIGMQARVKGVAFADPELQGKVVAVNAQASGAANGALPTFTAIVEVQDLKPQQQAWLKVGMSATVELDVEAHEKILVPIQALSQAHGQNIIHVLIKGKLSERIVATGEAQADSVVIESGLNAGDIVVYDK